MKRTVLPVTLAMLAFGISQVRSQEKEPPAIWSSQHRGLIRLSVELRKAVDRGDIAIDDAQRLAPTTCAVPEMTVMFLARRYHKDRDFAALADELAQQAKKFAAMASEAHEPAYRACGFYWGCFLNGTTSEICSVRADKYYRECLEGVRGPISQPKP